MAIDDDIRGLAIAGAICAGIVGASIGGGLIYRQCVSGTEQTRRIATPDYALENYRWFKGQSARLDQVKAQIDSTEGEITAYRQDFKDLPRADWPFDAREELARKESVLRGYVSQFNMLAGQYNERSSDLTRQWAKGSEPEELQPFLKEYTLLPTP
ncbi:hypothetical protein HYX13_03425 [Candidatus Woesearchaeota archaeon]|nr:hypothetical protein [Candidatus Woesearchaeota archaeon]